MTVFVYQDYVHNNGILFHRLSEYFGIGNISFCDADDILTGTLEKAALLVIPGGADLYYCEKLNGAGSKTIRSFVENGGTYFGICAGAYFACSEIEWAKNEKEPICGPRELAFFKGKATGPIYDFIEDANIEKSWMAAAKINAENTTCSVLYEAGPVFEDNGNAEVIARYSDLPGQPPAIIECTAGKGKAILCSPHLENNYSATTKKLYKHRNASHTWEQNVVEVLKPYDAQINQIWTNLLDRTNAKKTLEKAA